MAAMARSAWTYNSMNDEYNVHSFQQAHNTRIATLPPQLEMP